MRVPHQSPSVARTLDSTRGRRAADSGDPTADPSRCDAGRGVEPAAAEDCYRLRGLAQQICLNYS